MSTFIAPKLKVTFLQSFYDKELCVIPFILVFYEEPSKCFFTCPFDTNPFKLLLIAKLSLHHLVLNRQLTINVIFNLLYRRVSSLSFCVLLLVLLLLLRKRDLKPIGNFKYVSLLH